MFSTETPVPERESHSVSTTCPTTARRDPISAGLLSGPTHARHPGTDQSAQVFEHFRRGSTRKRALCALNGNPTAPAKRVRHEVRSAAAPAYHVGCAAQSTATAHMHQTTLSHAARPSHPRSRPASTPSAPQTRTGRRPSSTGAASRRRHVARPRHSGPSGKHYAQYCRGHRQIACVAARMRETECQSAWYTTLDQPGTVPECLVHRRRQRRRGRRRRVLLSRPVFKCRIMAARASCGSFGAALRQ